MIYCCFYKSFADFQNTNNNMYKILILTVLTLIVWGSVVPYCPGTWLDGSFQTNHVIASFKSANQLIENIDTQCYNLTLRQPFFRKPSVAIAMNSFDFKRSDNMFFSVKPLRIQDYSKLAFVVRTQWRYTYWNKLVFSYLATDRQDIQVGYYQVDSGNLAGCSSYKQTQTLIPFNRNYNYSLVARAFLHGFQINSVQINGYKTPIQISIVGIDILKAGLQVKLRVGSPTIVNSIYISYFATIENQFISSQVYTLQDIVSNKFNYTPVQPYGFQWLQFHGLSGFIMKNDNLTQNYFFESFWNGNQFEFNFGASSLVYLSYTYMLLSGNPCKSCNGFQLIFKQQCVPYCPQGTFSDGIGCITCGPNQIWNGSKCVQNCKGGRIWSALTDQCECPQGLYFNGFNCFACPVGRIWNSRLTVCQCPAGQTWNGNACINQCSFGRIFNAITRQCECPIGLIWNGISCSANICQNGQTFSPLTNRCQCPLNQYWNGIICLNCGIGQTWNQITNKCDCPYGTIWNGNTCISQISRQCYNGSIWNDFKQACLCPNGLPFNGYSCNKCSGGQLQNNGYCYCPQGSFWNNNLCQNCDQGKMWNGISCVPIACPPVNFWNGHKCQCGEQSICPPGTFYKQDQCIPVPPQCPYGTSWDGSSCISDSKQCPQGTYLKNSTCTLIPTQCPYGTQWDGYSCSIIGQNCPYGTNWNGQNCAPINKCQYGRIWNQKILQCTCDDSSYWNSQQCVACGYGKVFRNGVCQCPIGQYWNNSNCIQVNLNQCQEVKNSIWNGNQCVCQNGFIVKGYQCVCQGFLYEGKCKQCVHKPHSQYKDGFCKCENNYFQIEGNCIKRGSNQKGKATKGSCAIATYFDDQQKRCLPCSDGCLTCTDCYTCKTCREQYIYDHTAYLCREICGDGKRFSLECDDGNNIDGDGCSRDCRIQTGYTCFDGSPTNSDTCTYLKPDKMKIKQTGQTHLFGKIIINVQINYLPGQLLKSQCSQSKNCNKILTAQIVKGFKSATSIKTSYIPTTSYSFSIQIQFGIQPIGIFTVQVSLNKNIKEKYFKGINIDTSEFVEVNPAYLASENFNIQQDILV